MKPELFIIEPGLWQASTAEEIIATCDVLRELKLYALPYDKVTVRIPARDIMKVTGDQRDKSQLDERDHPKTKHLYLDITVTDVEWDRPLVIAYNDISECALDVTDRIDGKYHDSAWSLANGISDIDIRNAQNNPEILNRLLARDREALRASICDFLVSMLSTRNTVKSRSENKLAKLGIGKHKYKNRFRYTTTISLPRPEDMEDDEEHKPTGMHRAPHLRRAHIRRQHYGPKNSYVKSILIPSVFVNADPTYVSQREGYNITSRMERTDELSRQD